MSRPKITDTIGGYDFQWEEEKVAVAVSHIRSNHDGEVKGEVAVTTTLPGYAPHLHQARFNFSSTRSRNELAKQLADACKDVDWKPILEQLAVYTVERIRAGEPVLELMSGGDAHPPEYLLDPFIIRNYPTVFFGDPSSGKSTLALMMMTAMRLPWKDNPLGITAPKQVVKSILLDWETDPDTARWQLTCFQKGMELPEFPISYRHCALPLAEDVEQIAKAIAQAEAEVVVIDSVGLACGGELNEAGPVLRFFAGLRQLKITSLILAHTSKNPESKKRSIYGSVFFEAQARSVWEITKRQEAGEDELDVGLFHRKPPPFQKLHKPLGYQLTFGDGVTIVSPEEPKTIAEFMDKMGNRDRVLDLLRGGPLSTQEIAEQLEIARNTADQTVKRLRDRVLIVKIGEKWGLAARGDY